MASKFQQPDVTRAQLEKLMKNYQRTVKRIRKGDKEEICSDYDPKFDSKCVWFPREAVEQLFNDNKADGLRIYFGVHDSEDLPTPDDDRLTVVLVATRYEDGKNKDQLNDDSLLKKKELVGGGGPGYGLNHAAICPPSNCP
ncbi:hypothetical protein IM792_19165 [Mucilaginibacter sp. JRF]|uniref:hypothetical protein n=1 Tax=Mucilaginibacter sp. JRF TaxID=2780088 RepID=UPI001882AE8F|nr:hypothetical protein [Mucilaginibacter sp. JRF]MBE9586577.1 hypothetical protein [Mucilaginibacter sp. JRF]